MTQIFDEFRHLSPSPEFQAAIDHLESGQLPAKEAKRLAEIAVRAIVPRIPAGSIRMRECFWANIATWGAIALQKQSAYSDRKAAWLRMHRERSEKSGKQYPPNALFQAAYYAPVARWVQEMY